MAIETCENCKRIIGELEQAYTWQSHILCKECHARLSNSTVTQSPQVNVHTPVISPTPQRSLVKSTLIVMATVIVTIAVVSIVLFIPRELSSYRTQGDEARILTTKANLKMLENAVKQFKMDTGRYPTGKEGISVLIKQPIDVKGYQPGGYLDSTIIPKDSWGNDFVYQLSPNSYKQFVIVSYGADGQEGGEGLNTDLFSTDADW
ncbi:MAG: type II secretion system major pseudopilin GspG [Phycisphaerae bacterium]|nr:type II secretion system major pseudopilin GspG [Phycisphaerae bacterium]